MITREIVFRLMFKLAFIINGFIMMASGDVDELACYLSSLHQHLLGAVLFFGFGLWLAGWLKCLVQHDLGWSKIYDHPVNFNNHFVNGRKI